MGVGEDLLTEVIRFFNGTSSTVLCFNAPPLNGDYDAPVYTFPSFPTYTLAWVLLAIYPVLVVLAVAAGCCWGVHHDGTPETCRLDVFKFCSVLAYYIDVTTDVAALVDLSRCGESTAIVALLTAALLLPHAYWFTMVASVWPAIYSLRPTGYLPLPNLSTRLAVLFMPSLGLLTSFGTWCHCGVWELQEAGRAVVGLSPLLHVVEAFLEAAPSSVIIWTALFQVGNAERTVQRIHNQLLQHPGAALEIGQYPGVLRWINQQPAPTGFPAWRRFLWLFAFGSSVTRVTWQAFCWAAASAAEARSLKQPQAGLVHMVRPLWLSGLVDRHQSSMGWHGWVLPAAPFVLSIVAAVLVVVLS